MRLFVLIVSVVAASLCLPALAREPAKPIQQLTAEQWHEDLHFMAAELKSRHANLYHRISAEQFDAARHRPRSANSAASTQPDRRGYDADRGDGRRRPYPRGPAQGQGVRFPLAALKLYWFEEGIVVRAAKPEYRGLLGAHVEAVGAVPIAEAIRRTSEIISQDTISGARQLVPLYLAMPDILQALGLSGTTDAASLTLVGGGKRWTARVPVAEVAELWPPDTDIALMTPEGWADTRTAPLPLWLQAPLDYHRLVPLPEQKALYAQLNMVTDTDKETLGEFGRQILDQARILNPRTIVLDLRLNQGGNGDLRNGLIADLIRTQDADTRLFVLAGRGTFSASEFILEDLDRLTDAVFIGEPASSRPTAMATPIRSSCRIAVRGSQFDPLLAVRPRRAALHPDRRGDAIHFCRLCRWPRSGVGSRAFLSFRRRPSRLARAGGHDRRARRGGEGSEGLCRRSRAPLPRRPVRLIMAEQNLLGKKQGAAALAVSRWSSARFSRNPDLATVLAYVANQQGSRGRESRQSNFGRAGHRSEESVGTERPGNHRTEIKGRRGLLRTLFLCSRQGRSLVQ